MIDEKKNRQAKRGQRSKNSNIQKIRIVFRAGFLVLQRQVATSGGLAGGGGHRGGTSPRCVRAQIIWKRGRSLVRHGNRWDTPHQLHEFFYAVAMHVEEGVGEELLCGGPRVGVAAQTTVHEVPECRHLIATQSPRGPRVMSIQHTQVPAGVPAWPRPPSSWRAPSP